MPLGVKKGNFFSIGNNLGEPLGLIAKKYLTLDASKYLEQINITTGDAFLQFTQEAQKFDLRYSINFDSQYGYNSITNVSGTAVLPTGANPADYEVVIYTYTDIAYVSETVPLAQNRTFQSTVPVNKGAKICRLRTIDSQIVLAEDYVWNPTEGVRLPRSYNVDPTHSAFSVLRYRSFVYDVAVYVCALVSQNQEDAAANYLLAILKTQQREQADDAGNATNQDNNDRFPFSSYLLNPQFLIDAYYRTGAEAWVLYALLRFAEAYPGNSNTASFISRAFDGLIALYNMEYVYSTGLQDGSYKGGKGAYTTEIDSENNQLVYTGFDSSYNVAWCANEHNTDMYWVHKLFNQLAAVVTENFNALKKTANSGTFQTAGKSSAVASTLSGCIEFVYVDGSPEVALGTDAVGTGLTATQLSNGGVGIVVNSGNIDAYENGSLASAGVASIAKGDIVTIERDASGNFVIYKNGTSIHSATFTSTATMKAHFGASSLDTIAKIQNWAGLLSAKAYDRTYPVRSFSALHSDFSQNILGDLKSDLEAALVDSTKYWNSTDHRGRRGISDDSTLDDCHALDNLTWYGMALRDMGETTKSGQCLTYVTDGDDGTYANYDTLYSAQSFKPYVPNNGCYGTPVTTALTWTEGACGYIILQRAEGNDTDAISNFKEIAKVVRPDGIPYVTKYDNIYELQDWGCIIAAAWAVICNYPNGFWDLTYDQLVS